MNQFIQELEAQIKQRFDSSSDKSYVANLHTKGITKVAQKVGEEAIEVVVASLSETKDSFIEELADLYFHTLILMQEREVNFNDVINELKRRQGVSGLVEKASRDK